MSFNYLLVAGLILSFLLSPVQRSIHAMSGESNPPENHMVVVHSDQDGVVLELNSPPYEITDELIKGELFQKLSVDGASVLQEIGMVQIPVFHALIGVPPGADIKLDIQFDQAEMLHGSYRLLPSQVVGAINDDLQPGKYVYPANLSSAGLGMLGIYPEAPVLIVDDAWLRDQRIVKVAFYPFQYNPHYGSLIWHRNLQVAVEFKNEDNYLYDNPLIIRSADSPFDSILENVLLNYEDAKSWRGIPESIINQNSLPTPQNNQELATSIQPRYRIDIDKDGLYKLEYSDLLSAGVPVEGLDLSELHFHLSNQGRPVAVSVSDGDGIFNQGDSVLFYGQKFRGDYLTNQYYADESDFYRTYSSQDIYGNTIDWSPQFDATMMEKYTDTNVYWLTIDENSGATMESKGTANDPQTYSEHYRSTTHAEQSNFWHTHHFTGVDTWFWDKIEVGSTELRTYSIDLQSVDPGEHTTTLRGELVAITSGNGSPDHHVTLYLNDSEHVEPLKDITWDGKSRYTFEVQFPQSKLLEEENTLYLVAQLEDGMSSDLLYFDWFEIEYERQFIAENNKIWFCGEQTEKTQYTINGFAGIPSEDIWLIEITDPLEPVIFWGFSYSEVEGGLDFVLNRDIGEEYYEFYAGAAESVHNTQIKIYNPPDLSAPADYVIITHEEFLSEAQELANYRQDENFSTLVINFEDLINEYNFGIYHPIAIKNFLKHTLELDFWGQLPSYVLLIGDGHWNFKSYSTYESAPIYMPPNLAWVDPWQGEVDSANLLAAVVGDDPMPDLMIARMPVNSAFELESIVNKIKTYESYPIQGWQRNFTYVADNPDDAGDFEAVAEKLITEYIDEGYLAHRIYLDDYVDSGQCESNKQCPEATRDLINNINSIGAYFVNYIGHASIDSWANEQLLVDDDVILLDNETRLPIVLSSTCLDGYWIYPNKIGENERPSLIEVLLRAKGSGAVAAFSPTGLGVSTGHEYLQDGFYQAVFDDGIDILGEASMAAKMRLFLAGVHVDLLHTFTVFGDPALKLNILPQPTVYYYLHLPTLMNNAASIVLP